MVLQNENEKAEDRQRSGWTWLKMTERRVTGVCGGYVGDFND